MRSTRRGSTGHSLPPTHGWCRTPRGGPTLLRGSGMASKPVPLAKRFAEMLREEQAGAAPAGPSEDPLDVLIGHGGRAKEKERLEYLADNGRYLEKKEA